MNDFTSRIYNAGAMTNHGINYETIGFCNDPVYLIGADGNEIEFHGKSGYSHIGDVYELTYTDGRKQIVSEHDLVLNGNNIVPAVYMYEGMAMYEFKQPKIDFDHAGIAAMLNPKTDSYILGCFLGGSDFEKPFVTIRGMGITYTKVADYIRYGHDITGLPVRPINPNKVKGSNMIYWKDIIHSKDVTTDKIITHILSMVMYANFQERLKFCMGCLDIQREFGIPSKLRKNQIYSIYPKILTGLQWMLASVGINAVINGDSLTVVMKHNVNPTLSYDVDTVEAILKENRFLYDDQWKLTIRSFKKLGSGVVWNLASEDMITLIYLDHNLLPRVSAPKVFDINI